LVSAPVIIAIDGPAGAGKSTVARRVAAELGIDYLDTGAMYRAVTFGVLSREIDPSDAESVIGVCRDLELNIGVDRIVVDGVDATSVIRGPEVTSAVSAVAATPAVRQFLVELQRAWIRERGSGVVEGRDITTVVLPDADLKLFVTASPRVRAERRVAESGGDVDAVEAAIAERDRRDETREASPLSISSDAVVIDTSEMSIDDVVADVLARVKG
jgi:cytidylate kinase